MYLSTETSTTLKCIPNMLYKVYPMAFELFFRLLVIEFPQFLPLGKLQTPWDAVFVAGEKM